MGTITIVKNDQGRFVGLTRTDQVAYNKFLGQLRALEIGELFEYNVVFPRNPKFHGLHFAMVTAFFDAQEKFDDVKAFRRWLYVGAGFADFVPAPSYMADVVKRLPRVVRQVVERFLVAGMIAVPRSIAFDELEEEPFREVHAKVIEFLRGVYCRRYLWPHLDDRVSFETVETILEGFDR